MAKRGAFIVIEGCDRSGKSTQCKKLINALGTLGTPAELMKFPERSTCIGKMINEYLSQKSSLNDTAIHLLFSANRWELASTIVNKLENGINLIVDRYAYSGVAYTSAKSGFTLEWCKQPDVGLPKPDSVIYLDLPPDVAEARGDYGEERYEKKEFQEKVSKSFQRLRDIDWRVIDANRSVEEIHNDILRTVTSTIESDLPIDIPKLWITAYQSQSACRS